MKEAEIISEIAKVVRTYHLWTIGITADPEQRKSQHKSDGKDVSSWRQWKADTEQQARNVEHYFLDKGIEGGGGGGDRPTYVYIF